MNEIKLRDTFETITPLTKGRSSDEKYRVLTKDGRDLLLRISDISEYDRKKEEFEIVSAIHKEIENTSEPVEFGLCRNGTKVYMLLSWVEGEDLETVLPALSESEQYDLGYRAGELLRDMHTIPIPPDAPEVYHCIANKIEKRWQSLKESGIEVPHADELYRYLQDNLWKLSGVEPVLCHGDYHPGNIIYRDGDIHIIDFNRFDYADPYESSARISAFTSHLSVPFAKGQIIGCFGCEPDEEFFGRMAFYSARIALFSPLWTHRFGEEEFQKDLKRCESIYRQFKGFTTTRPVWW